MFKSQPLSLCCKDSSYLICAFNKSIAFGLLDKLYQFILFVFAKSSPYNFSSLSLFFNKCIAFGLPDKWSQSILFGFFSNNLIAFGFKDTLYQLILVGFFF